jgi:hypothetical protein
MDRDDLSELQLFSKMDVESFRVFSMEAPLLEWLIRESRSLRIVVHQKNGIYTVAIQGRVASRSGWAAHSPGHRG